MKNLVHDIAESLLGHDDDVEVNEINGDQTTVIELKVNPEDLGKIIGRQGRTANAIRTLVNAAALKAGKRAVLEILERPPSENLE